jgi:hypothetical protein
MAWFSNPFAQKRPDACPLWEEAAPFLSLAAGKDVTPRIAGVNFRLETLAGNREM